MGEIVVPSVEGVLTSDDVQATVDAIAEWQLPNGMVPWYPGGHADPWNHVEAAMALALGGRVAEAERAYDWLVGLQLPDGSWHQYYVEDGVEDDKFDLNVVAYVAAGVWHHWLLTWDIVEQPRITRLADRILNPVLGKSLVVYARKSAREVPRAAA